MELRTVRVFVHDLPRARVFYERTLGLRLVADGSAHGYGVFDAGGCELVVEVVRADAPEEERALVGRFTGFSFTVDNVAETHLALQALGVRFAGLPETQLWGGILATFEDPCGNQLQIVQRPARG